MTNDRKIGERKTTAKSTFTIGGVSSSADSFVVAECFVLLINISGKMPTIANLQNVIWHFMRPL
jgi:hypothetical protein